MNKRLLIHAGWNKTGTSFLQRHVFTPLVGSGCCHSGVTLTDLQCQLPNEELPLLISDESLLGVTIYKRADSRNEQRLNFLRAWRRIAPHTQFILGVREHTSFIESLYRQYLQMGGACKPYNFFDLTQNSGYVRREELYYSPLLQTLHEWFPEPHFIFDFAELKVNQRGLLDDLLTFIGCNKDTINSITEAATNEKFVNSSISFHSGQILRILNKLVASNLSTGRKIPLKLFTLATGGRTPRRLLQYSFKFKQDKYFFNEMQEEIAEYYKEDWKLVHSLIGHTRKVL